MQEMSANGDRDMPQQRRRRRGPAAQQREKGRAEMGKHIVRLSPPADETVRLDAGRQRRGFFEECLRQDEGERRQRAVQANGRPFLEIDQAHRVAPIAADRRARPIRPDVGMVGILQIEHEEIGVGRGKTHVVRFALGQTSADTGNGERSGPDRYGRKAWCFGRSEVEPHAARFFFGKRQRRTLNRSGEPVHPKGKRISHDLSPARSRTQRYPTAAC